jgi:hypothetical protein
MGNIFRVGTVSNITRQRNTRIAIGIDLTHHRLQCVVVFVSGNHSCTFVHETPNRLLAYTGRGTGDDCNLVFEPA